MPLFNQYHFCGILSVDSYRKYKIEHCLLILINNAKHYVDFQHLATEKFVYSLYAIIDMKFLVNVINVLPYCLLAKE